MELTDELYMQYAGVIDRMVARYSRTFSFIDTDELTLQAGLIFCQAAKSFDPGHQSGCSFKTYLEKQLHALTHVVDKQLHGPSLVNSDKPWAPVSLDSAAIDDEGNELEPATNLDKSVQDGYSSSLSSLLEDDLPTAMAAYIHVLTDDSRTILEDILDGRLDPNAKTMEHLNKKSQAKERTLSAWKIYKKRYAALGWTWDRTRQAFNNLSSTLNLYRQDRLPCRIIRAR